MITIIAEKPDVGKKIAAALDKITLSSGKTVSFDELDKYESAVKSQQSKDGYLKIAYAGDECYVTWGFGHLCQLKQAKDYNAAYANWRSMPLPLIPENYELILNQIPNDKTGYNAKIKKQFSIVKGLINKSDYVINATDFDREGEVIFAYIYELAKCKKPIKRACFASQTKGEINNAFKSLKDGSEMKSVEAAGRMRSIADWVVGANLTVAMTLHQNEKGNILSVGRVQTPTLKMLVDRELAIKNFKAQKFWTVEAVFTTPEGDTYPGTHTTKRFDSKADADAVVSQTNKQTGTITNISEKRVTKESPQLYSLSALQMDANSKYGMTLKETLDAAQALYDNGYTTYPRTDSRYLTEVMEPTVNEVLDKLQTMSEYKALIDKKPRVFNKKKYFDDKKVESHFAIIPTGVIPNKSKMNSNMEKVYDLIARSVICMLYGNAILAKTSVTTTVKGNTFSSSGSKVVNAGYMTVVGTEKDVILPDIKEGMEVFSSTETKERESEPPKRYTDKTLLAAMISAGKDLEDDELKKILADPSVAGIGTPATRDAIIETLIKRGYVVRSKKSLAATDKGVSLIDCLPVDAIKSPEMTARWEKRLHEIERGKDSASSFRHDIEASTQKWCEQIKASKAAIASSMSSSTASGSSANVLKCVCPVCGKPMRKLKWGYGCSGYTDGCKFSIGTICGKTLTEKQVERLLTAKDSGLIKGFKSKAGKSFEAHLWLDEDNSVKFRFDS